MKSVGGEAGGEGRVGGEGCRKESNGMEGEGIG